MSERQYSALGVTPGTRLPSGVDVEQECGAAKSECLTVRKGVWLARLLGLEIHR